MPFQDQPSEQESTPWGFYVLLAAIVVAITLMALPGCGAQTPTIIVLPGGDTNQNTNIGIGVGAPAPVFTPTPTPAPTATPTPTSGAKG